MRMPDSRLNRIHLPIDDVEAQVIALIHENDTCVVIGETGCGKSTQIPQVGYRVRFENNTSDNTDIVYMTDGILMREAIEDGLLKKYSVVIVDEAHERSVHSDILLSILKLAQKQRRESRTGDLKIIIMSATLHSELFSRFFNNAPVYLIKGRTFPVEVLYAESLDSDESDYLYNTIVTVIQVHRQEPITDDILVFLTGQEEIETACKRLRDLNKEMAEKMYVLPLYAALRPSSQQKIFEPARQGYRKVIMATNIAETSLTIPGVRIVIDSGKVKQKSYNAINRTDILCVQSISKAQVVLELVAMGLKKLRSLKMVEQPSEDLMEAAVKQLQALGALTSKQNKLKMTPEGFKMSKFPVEPEHAKMLLSAEAAGCMEEMLVIVAALSGESLFSFSPNQENTFLSHLSTQEGDHLSMLNAFRLYTQEKKRKNGKALQNWAAEKGLSLRALTHMHKVRKQLREIAVKLDMKCHSSGANKDILRESIAKGLFMNACEWDATADCYRLLVTPSVKVKMHPSSCLTRSKPTYFVFSSLLKTKDLFAKEITVIRKSWIEDAVTEYRKRVLSH